MSIENPMSLSHVPFKKQIDKALEAGMSVVALICFEWRRVWGVTVSRRYGLRLHHEQSSMTGETATVVKRLRRSILITGGCGYQGEDVREVPILIVFGNKDSRRMARFGPEHVTYDDRGLVGKSFGKLTITETRGWIKRQRMVMCRCECGGTKLARYSSLLRGWVKSCGCLRGKNTELPLEPGACYGQLTIIEQVPRPLDARKKEGHYRVRCVCGGEHVRGREAIVDRKSADCGCGGYAALAGQRFGRLTALNQTKREGKQRLILTRCDCRVESFARVGDLLSGRKRSCGCLKARRPAPPAA